MGHVRNGNELVNCDLRYLAGTGDTNLVPQPAFWRLAAKAVGSAKPNSSNNPFRKKLLATRRHISTLLGGRLQEKVFWLPFAFGYNMDRGEPCDLGQLWSNIMKRICLALWLGAWAIVGPAAAAEAPKEKSYERKEDVIYGRKFGTALTMDVFTPKKNANGAAVIWVVSGGWFSDHKMIVPDLPYAPVNPLVQRGYTVFAVVHGCQPKFTIPEILQDMHRAVRYIRYHAKDYHIDRERIGITGGSAGGHLSLMQGTAGDKGNPKAPDPVDRASSRVQAVACFFPPTDFLNYGKPGENALGRGILKDFKAPFEFHEFNPKLGVLGRFLPITDEKKILEIGRQISPINHVTADDPPALIIHGDKDKLVPMQQAEIMVEKFKKVGVPAKLVVKKGAGHGWLDIDKDMPTTADWFDKYLKKK
jgi:acetyl esterase/lipase